MKKTWTDEINKEIIIISEMVRDAYTELNFFNDEWESSGLSEPLLATIADRILARIRK